jgi:Protein of unknown function (DUF3592)
MELFWPVLEKILEFAALLAVAWVLRKLATRVNRSNQVRSQGWPSASGWVEWAAPKMVGEGHTAYWAGEVTYSYSVRGEYYAGRFEFPASGEDAAWKAVEGWKGRSVVIRYSPSEPATSVLVVDEQNPGPG